MLPQFINKDLTEKLVIVKEAEEINLGKHTLQFFMAPMVHWPEVMVTYEKTEKYYSLQTVLESSEHWTQTKNGTAKQEDIILI